MFRAYWISWGILTWAAIALGGLGPIASADDYVRLTKSADGVTQSLDVAVVSYTGNYKNVPVQVDLVGAVHIGDSAFYAGLNALFKTYEALLFELILPEDTPELDMGNRIPSGLSLFQMSLTKLLDLEFQLDGINYRAPNFVHADMTAEEFARTMSERGESFGSIFVRLLMGAYREQLKDPTASQATRLRFTLSLLSSERALLMKRALAQQFDSMEGLLASVNDSTLIGKRNDRALTVLRQELEAGRHRLGIFYGAGHFPDMAKKLVSEFNLQQSGIDWRVAWNMR